MKERAARDLAHKRYAMDKANQILVKGKLDTDDRVTVKCDKASGEARQCIQRIGKTILSVKEVITNGK